MRKRAHVCVLIQSHYFIPPKNILIGKIFDAAAAAPSVAQELFFNYSLIFFPPKNGCTYD